MRVLIWHAETGELLDDFSYIPLASQFWHRRNTPIRIEFRDVFTDLERINWLDADNNRLEDVRNRMNNENENMRKAIDVLMQM